MPQQNEFCMGKILVIDDEPDVLQIVRAVLTTKGHEVLQANGGELGLELARQHHPELIICDLMMPRVSGLEVIKRLRKDPDLRAIPLVVLSALGDDEKRPADFWKKTLGVDDYVQKPFDPLDLLGRIEYIFRRGTYVSHTGPVRPAGKEPAPAQQGEIASRTNTESETSIPTDLKDSQPRDVVRAFIESWNRQDFATEYQCMGEEMIGHMGLHDYVNLRRQTYLEEKGQERWQSLAEVVEEKISVNVAKVVVDRDNILNGQTKRRRETYTLKRTHKGWKIVVCRSARPGE
jgi:DNA-binding response OmpR family regulator